MFHGYLATTPYMLHVCVTASHLRFGAILDLSKVTSLAYGTLKAAPNTFGVNIYLEGCYKH